MTPESEGPRWRRWLRVALLRGPFWEASRKRRWLRLGLVATACYVGVLLVLLALENRLLYAGANPGIGWSAPPPGSRVEELRLPTEDGNTIVAWWLAPPGWRPEHGAVHYSHGNGHNVSHMVEEAQRWERHFDRAVLFYDYPGFGRSSGRPTEAGCYHAADAAYRWLVEEKGVPPGEVLLVGTSLGAAIATEMATRHDHRLLVLMAPFSSFPDIAQDRVPYFPVRWLTRNKLDNVGKIGRVRAPVFVVHGDADVVVPLRMGRAVYEAAPGSKRFLVLPGHGHHYPTQPEFFAAVRRFLAEVRARGS